MIGAPAAASLVAGAGQAPQSQNLAALVTSLMGGGSLGTYQKNNRAYPPDVQTALGDLRLAQKQQSPGYGSIDGATWGNVVAALLQPMAGRKKEKKAREGMAEAAKAQAAAADKSDQTKRARDFADHVRQTNYDRATAPEQAADTPEKIRLFEYAQKLAETDPDAAQKFLEYYGGKGGGVTINTGEKGPQYGSIPQGYMVQDGQMLPVPGSPADMEMQEAAGKADAREESRASKADNVVDEIDHAMDLLGTGTAGIPGALTRRIPGTDAVDFEAAMKTVLGNVGFDRLQKMREESPTGGALGQVSNLELGLLTSTVAGYDPNMSEEGKRRTLDKIKRHYGNFKQALSGQMPAEYEEQGAPQAADPLEEMAQQAIENGADPEAVRARMEQMRAQQGG